MERNIPTVADARRAGLIIKKYCESQVGDDACLKCGINSMCCTNPYTWDSKGADTNAK